jgi:hypothetical protein
MITKCVAVMLAARVLVAGPLRGPARTAFSLG